MCPQLWLWLTQLSFGSFIQTDIQIGYVYLLQDLPWISQGPSIWTMSLAMEMDRRSCLAVMGRLGNLQSAHTPGRIPALLTASGL